MNHDKQEGTSTSMRSQGASQGKRSHDNLSDVTNTLDSVASDYDVQYKELCHMLEDVVDSIECIKDHRKTNVDSIRHDIEQLIKAVDEARRSATDTNSVENRQNQVIRLEKEKKQLVTEILSEKDEKERLRSKLQRVEMQMAAAREECESVKGQGASEVPSLEYMKKVLHRLSQVYLSPKGDGEVLQGFVSQEGGKDVRPFRFDESTSHFEQVNSLWEIISEECS